MDSAIFKAYDIRGTVPDQLDTEAAGWIGRAIGRYLGEGTVVVGRDMRESGIPIREALVHGLRAEGMDVIDIGRVATPMVYFATLEAGAIGGVMITASHNPGAYNGFKLCAKSAVPIGIETGLLDIRDSIPSISSEPIPPMRGSERSDDVKERYYDSLCELFPVRPRLRVVIDAGNGIAGEAVEGLLARLPLDVTRMYFEPDGTFPNHEADPIKAENLRDLQAEVMRTQADLGIAFDGDGDRAVFVDETGAAVPADLMTAFLAKVVLKHGLLGADSNSKIVYDLRSSRAVAETVEALGAEAIRSRVGHAFIKATMRERGACFGGELSGHYYFRFPSGYIADDGAAAMMLLFQALELEGGKVSELWQPYRRYFQTGELNRRVDDVNETLSRVRARYTDGESDELDGLTISYADWWFNLRPSNTEPLLRLNVEGPTESETLQRRDEILAVIDG